MDPINAYLELLDQPDKSIPYTPTEDTAGKYIKDKSLSVNITPKPKGITAHPMTLSTKEKGLRKA